MIEYLESIPVPCLIGLVYACAFLVLPIAQRINYWSLVKRYGKEEADEMMARW